MLSSLLKLLIKWKMTISIKWNSINRPPVHQSTYNYDPSDCQTKPKLLFSALLSLVLLLLLARKWLLRHSMVRSQGKCRHGYSQKWFARFRDILIIHTKIGQELNRSMKRRKPIWNTNTQADGRQHLPREKVIFFVNCY